MLAYETLKMLERAGTIAACLLELRHREEGIVGIGGEWILHDDPAIVALRIGRRLRERTSPVQGIAVTVTALLLAGKERIHERPPSDPVSFAHQASCTMEE
jgi:hypothetical protein